MAKMVDSHHHLYAHLVYLPIVHDQACVVYQDIDMIKLFTDLFCKLLDRPFFREVQLITFDAAL